MKRMKISILVAMTLSLFMTSCMKEQSSVQEPNKIVQLNTQALSTATLSDIYNSSREIHNNYLTEEYAAIAAGSVSTISDLQSWGTSFFQNAQFSSNAISAVNQEFFSIYGTAGFTQHLNGVIGGNTKIAELQYWLENSVSPTNMPDIEVFQSLIDQKLQEVINDGTLTDEEKSTSAAVLGVASGSYEYWNKYIGDWFALKGNNNPTASETMSRGYKLFIEDCRGGSWGGLIGSFLPAVGNVAGAVMGGAILSAAEALSW